MKIWKLLLGIVLVPILLIGGCAALVWQQENAAKRFCESLIPQIEQARAQSGHYPIHADPNWWAGRNVPSLIRTQRFYFARDSGFGFRFQNDLAFMDNVSEFSSADKDWFSYDANRETR